MIPELRFHEFANEEHNNFKKYSFEDIFLFSTGKNIKQREASPEFETPCVRYGELYHMYNEVIYEIVNRTNLDKSELCFSEGNEILLPSAGEDPLDIGSASALTIKNIAIGRTINILKPKIESLYSQIFVSYYINQQLKRKISSLAKGVSISNVYNSDLKKLDITLPVLPEQTKIANFLTAVDNRISLLQKKKTELTQYKKGVMQKLFSQEIRFKQDDGSDKVNSEAREGSLGCFPDWEEKRLGEVASFSKGKGISKADIAEDGTTECIRYGELYTVYSEVISKIVSKTNIDENELVLSEENDVIIPASGETQIDIATASCVKRSGIALGGDLNIIKSQIDGLFLSYYLNNARKRNIARLAQGISVVHLYASQLAILKIDLPCLREQQKIANFLSSIDKSIENIANQIEQSQKWKKGLLQRMFV